MKIYLESHFVLLRFTTARVSLLVYGWLRNLNRTQSARREFWKAAAGNFQQTSRRSLCVKNVQCLLILRLKLLNVIQVCSFVFLSGGIAFSQIKWGYLYLILVFLLQCTHVCLAYTWSPCDDSDPGIFLIEMLISTNFPMPCFQNCLIVEFRLALLSRLYLMCFTFHVL